MGLALFGNPWAAATYAATVGDAVPRDLAARVNGIAGFGDNEAALVAILLTGAVGERYGWSLVANDWYGDPRAVRRPSARVAGPPRGGARRRPRV